MELQEHLNTLSTLELQDAIKYSKLNDEAAVIAKSILLSRNATIPDVIPAEVLEENVNQVIKQSNKLFLSIAITVVIWLAYDYATGLFDGNDTKRITDSIRNLGLFVMAEAGLFTLAKKKK